MIGTDLLTVAEALKDPVLIVAATWAALELRELRRRIRVLFEKSEGYEEVLGELEDRVRDLERRPRKLAS